MKLSVTLPLRLGEIEVNFQPELNALFWFFSIQVPIGTTGWYTQGILLGVVVLVGQVATSRLLRGKYVSVTRQRAPSDSR